MTFLILALPRSRTTWLSKFLTYGRWTCGHDEVCGWRSLEDATRWARQPFVGSVETALAPFWRAFPKDLRIAIIRRSPVRVLESIAKYVPLQRGLERQIWRLDAKLDQIEKRVPGVFSIDFADLERKSVAQELFRFCLGEALPEEWWYHYFPLNIQSSLLAKQKFAEAFAEPMFRLCDAGKAASLAKIRKEKALSPGDDCSFQMETLSQFLAEGQACFAKHALRVGEAPEAWKDQNLELIVKMDELKNLLFFTVRQKGEIIAYTAVLLAPSFEDKTLLTSINTLTFASNPWLELRFLKYIMGELSAKGVGKAFFRSGLRGTGPRMEIVYKKLGATKVGSLFELDLRENFR